MKDRKRLILGVPVALAALCAMPQYPEMRVAGNADGRIVEKPSIKVNARRSVAVPQSESNLQASFTIRGAGVEQTVWDEDFETSATLPDGWSADPTTKAVWSLKKPTSTYSDAGNARALYIEGDYRAYNREISSATSAPFEVPDEAMLRAQIYYSINYDDYCRLIISVSDDDFENDITEIWNSKDGTGDKAAHWHAVETSLAKYAGKTVRLRFTYSWGAKDESFKTGGYMGYFYIDGIAVTAPGTVDRINVTTGETIDFVDTSTGGGITSWEWSFPGATPATSTEKNPTVYYTLDGAYDVSLTVTDGEGHRSTATLPAFVTVTGYEPTARMSISDGFRYLSTLCPMVAPLADVTFTDASEGYPTEHSWKFIKYNDNTGALVTSEEKEGAEVSKSFEYLHKWDIEHTVSNQHGTSKVTETVSAEYSGSITNFRSGDFATTFDLEGMGTFPGNNRMKMTKFAEKFSKPTAPLMVSGVNVYFATAKAEQLADQITNIGVHIYTSENGIPGECLDSWWWQISDLDASSDASVGTWFPFPELPVVDDEFFIVIDGFTDLYEDTDVSIYMADFRGEHNTTYMYKDNNWVDVSTYFPAGRNHTSLLAVPSVSHSVMASATGDEPVLTFNAKGGKKEFSLFSFLGYKSPVETGADWCRVTNEPNGMTVDNLAIECDPLPDGTPERETTVTLTDGHSVYTITVRQVKDSGIEGIETDGTGTQFVTDGLRVSTTDGTEITLYTVQGARLASGITVEAPSAGMYIAVAEGKAVKMLLK